MATATAPTAPTVAIDPAEPAVQPSATATDSAPAAPARDPGPLARILTPVEPARPVRPLGTTAVFGQTAEDAEGASSKKGSDKGATVKGGGRDSAVGALVRALAERLRRTGTTTSIKRTHDVKEARVSGNTRTATSANRAERLARRDGQHRTSRDAKLADLKNKQQHGRDSRDRKQTAATDAKTSGARTSKADSASRNNRDVKKGDTSDRKTSGARTSRADTASKGDGKDHRDARVAKGEDTKATSDRTRKDGGAARPGGPLKPGGTVRDPKGLNAKVGATGAAKTAGAQRDAADPKAGPPSGPSKRGGTGPAGAKAAKGGAAAKPAARAKGNGGAAARPSSTAPTKTTDPKGLNAKTAAATKRAGTEPVDLTKGPSAPTAPNAPAAAPKLRTRPAREAGYRDGTRAAGAVGQARAYRDGARDGWDDRTAADKAEGKTMTDTRARNAARPQQAAGPKMAPASGSTVDLAKKPAPAPAAVPVTVTAVGDKAIGFTGADGEPHTMSRGEVRTLKAFERRLADKGKHLGRIQEGSKGTRVVAVELATRAQRLAEDAKAVKGGAGVVARLLRLAERSQALRLKAVEIEKNARRGTEAVKVLAANAETRHGGIYKAVVDSPLTTPAERKFYQDKQGS